MLQREQAVVHKVTPASRCAEYQVVQILHNWVPLASVFDLYGSIRIDLLFCCACAGPVSFKHVYQIRLCSGQTAPPTSGFMFRKLCAVGRRCGFPMDRLLKTAFTINNKVLKHLFKGFMSEFFNPLNSDKNNFHM